MGILSSRLASSRKIHFDAWATIAFILCLLGTALFHAVAQGVSKEDLGIWGLTFGVNLAFLVFFLRGPRKLPLRLLAHVTYYSVAYLVLDAFTPTLGGKDWARFLQAADEWAFGFQPSRELHRLFPDFVHEVFALGYALFLPYLYVNVFRSLLRDGPHNARRFAVGFATVYAVGYLGYLFLPSLGPRFFADAHSDQSAFAAITDGPFLSAALSTFMSDHSGHHNVFPSLHAAASLFVLIFEFRYRSRRVAFWTLPIVFGIWVGTVYHGYHYVVDLVGALILVVLGFSAIAITVKTRPRDRPLLRTRPVTQDS